MPAPASTGRSAHNRDVRGRRSIAGTPRHRDQRTARHRLLRNPGAQGMPPSAVIPLTLAATGVRSTARPDVSVSHVRFAVQDARWACQIARDGERSDSRHMDRGPGRVAQASSRCRTEPLHRELGPRPMFRVSGSCLEPGRSGSDRPSLRITRPLTRPRRASLEPACRLSCCLKIVGQRLPSSVAARTAHHQHTLTIHGRPSPSHVLVI